MKKNYLEIWFRRKMNETVTEKKLKNNTFSSAAHVLQHVLNIRVFEVHLSKG